MNSFLKQCVRAPEILISEEFLLFLDEELEADRFSEGRTLPDAVSLIGLLLQNKPYTQVTVIRNKELQFQVTGGNSNNTFIFHLIHL
jgi:hypothetical protein